MQISSKDFFNGLNVDFRYYTKVFSNIGVKSTFFFDEDDLNLIQSLPISRYKSAKVVNRAKSFLEVLSCQN
jgi:hypothetical protein